MRGRILIPMIVVLLWGLALTAKPLESYQVDIAKHPPRIIRSCCLFGSKVGVVAVPFFSLTVATGNEDIGNHRFMGGSSEQNGILYTRNGGFIDTGHMRDIADLTAWFYSLFQAEKHLDCIVRDMGREGGEKTLSITIPSTFTDHDVVQLAGRVAYDLSVWHEIATWFGAKSVPLVPEKFSSFSAEDAYSNLLGVTLGMAAVESDLPYEEAMTRLVADKFKELGAVDTESESLQALEAVRDKWWTREYRLPGRNVTMIRQTQAYGEVLPLLITHEEWFAGHPIPLTVPVVTSRGEPLTAFYSLNIRLNRSFPYKEIFPDTHQRIVCQNDFEALIRQINLEVKPVTLKNNTRDKKVPEKID